MRQTLRIEEVRISGSRGERVGGEFTYALECALDELAEAMQLGPIELRRRIEPETDPTSGNAFSSRHLVETYRRGAERFGWDRRNPTPRSNREGECLIPLSEIVSKHFCNVSLPCLRAIQNSLY